MGFVFPQKADKKLVRFCENNVMKEGYEDRMVDAIRYADPGRSVQTEFCYAHHKECTTRDIEGGQLVAPVRVTCLVLPAVLPPAARGRVEA